MDDGAAFLGCFGWGVEHGHLGKSETFYRATSAPGAEEASTEWRKQTSMRSLEGCFAVPRGLPPDIVEPRISNYLSCLWKMIEAFGPNGLDPKRSMFG